MTATLIADGALLDVNSAEGSGVRLRLELTNDDGVPLDVTAWAFAGQVRRKPDDPVQADLTFDNTSEGAEGVVYVTLDAADAAVGRWGYAVEYDTGDGLGMVPLIYGQWTLRQQWRHAG